MAIEPIMADVLRKLASKPLPSRDILCLGYPDVLSLGEAPTEPDLQSIARWHRWPHGVTRAEAFFAELDLQPTYWDIVRARGPEVIVDLNVATVGNRPIGGPYGLVVDPGTIEHLANPGNAFALLSQICAIGGYVAHANPLAMGNHGMWSIHPTLYTDFYQANGFEIEIMAELSGPLASRTVRAVPVTKRFEMAQNGVMLAVARKERDVPLTWPTQSKYRGNPTLRG